MNGVAPRRVTEPLAGGALDSVIWAFRAVRAETLGFHFAYPLEMDPAAGPKESLHYYLYSDSLAWDVLKLDRQGVALCEYPTTGPVYRPGFVAWYGLVNLGHYLRRANPVHLQIFLKQVNWLEENAVRRNDGAVVWPHHFDCLDGSSYLKAPWLSANAHGLAVSVLVRGWRITGRASLRELLDSSWKVFGIDLRNDGLREVVNGNVLFTELRGRAILDHFLTALLALYDLSAETGNPAVGRLFAEGVEGLKGMLSNWDYRNKWSWYGPRSYLSSPAYHSLNRLLLGALARLSNEPMLSRYADAWSPDRLSIPDRVEVFLKFFLTKNVSRLKHRTWRLKRIKARTTSPLAVDCAAPAGD